MISKEQIPSLKRIKTPFYFYDMELLGRTLSECKTEADKFGYKIHYAIKANAESRILETISSFGFGADCVSGGEIKIALKTGFDPGQIFYSGVGKRDDEITLALKSGIGLLVCESIPEIRVIDALATKLGLSAKIAIRINPDIDAHTHNYICTGRKEDKFGINPDLLEDVLETLKQCSSISLVGLHAHVGSQITDITVFELLCKKINGLQNWFKQHGIRIEHVDLGGGLGVNYTDPYNNQIPDFSGLFAAVAANLRPLDGQTIHFEPGRSLVAQCGDLVSQVLYVKEGSKKKFLILDAGMNDLIRPALYGAYHQIENLTSDKRKLRYDVVGPVCESDDCWGKNRPVAMAARGDLVAIHSAGAYGQVMAMRYNQKAFAKAYYSDTIK